MHEVALINLPSPRRSLNVYDRCGGSVGLGGPSRGLAVRGTAGQARAQAGSGWSRRGRRCLCGRRGIPVPERARPDSQTAGSGFREAASFCAVQLVKSSWLDWLSNVGLGLPDPCSAVARAHKPGSPT